MRASRASLTAVAAVTGVLLVTFIVTWAASIGPGAVLTGEGPTRFRIETPETTLSPTDPLASQRERTEQPPPEERTTPSWVRGLALLLEIALVLGLVVLVGRWARSTYQDWDARRRPPAEDDERDFDVLGAPEVLAERLRDDEAEQQDLLRSGSPRNGIVECWHRFERLAGDLGLPRHPWETSSEFTIRMLDLVGADSHAVARFASLYREARFSEHPLDEAARAEALATLDAVHLSLAAGRAR